MDRKFAIKLGITLSLLIYIALKIDWHQITATVSDIRLLPFFTSYLVLLVCSIPLAIRLRILLKPTVLQLSLNRLIQVQFISQFYSVLLPSGVGISIARWYKITQNRLGRRVFVVVTLIERAMLTLTLLLCTGIPLLFVQDEAVRSFRSSALPVIFLLIFLCFFFFSFFLHPWVYEKFTLTMRWLESRFRSDLLGKILRVYEDFGIYIDKRHLLIKAFLFHSLYQGLSFLYFCLLFVAIGVTLPSVTILWISMLVMLVLTLPITIGGLGVREAGFAWLLALYGIDPEKGVILGGMIFIHLILNVGVGAVLNMLEKGHAF